MKSWLIENKNTPYIIERKGIIAEVNQPFLDMTEYSRMELQCKEISEIFNILRIGPNVKIENINEKTEYFLFTKPMEVRFVHIKTIRKSGARIYIFREVPNSRLEDKFAYPCQLLSENIVGVSIYSAPDFTLLKANQIYLDFFDAPNNTSNGIYGRQMNDFITEFKGSPIENVLKNIIATGKSEYLKEFVYDKFQRGITYWDQIITPIKVDGEVKYIVTNTQEVTERVLNRIKIQKQIGYEQIIRKQRLKLENANILSVEIMESINEGIFYLDNEWRFKYINKRAANNFGFESGDLFNQNIWDKFIHIKATVIEKNFRHVMFEHESIQFEFLGILNDRYYHYLVYPNRGGISVYMIDITERKKAEEALRESEEKYRTLFSSMNEGFSLSEVIYDSEENPRDFRFLEINKAYEEQTGLKAADIVGRTLLEIAPDMESSWIETLAKVAITGESVRYEDYNRSTQKYYETVIFSPKKGYVALLVKDISERRRIEAALRESEELLRTVIENSRDGINMLDLATGRYVFMSQTQVELTGFSAEEINNITVEEACERMHPDDRELSAAQQKLVSDGLDIVSTVEYRWRVKSGEYRWFSDNRKLIRDAQGQPVAMVGVSRDITESKKAEVNLKHQKELLEAIIGHMSDGLYISDKDGKFVMINAEGKRQLYQSDSVKALGESFNTIKYFDMKGNEISKNRMPGIRALIGEKVRNERMWLKRPDRDMFISASATPIYDDNGNINMVVVCSRDVTEEVKQEKTIEFQKKQLETVFNNMPDAVFLFDKDKKYYFTNKAARETYPHSLFNKIGDSQKVAESYTMEGTKIPQEDMPAFRVLRGESISSFRFAYKMQDETFYFDVSGSPINDGNNGDLTTGVLCFRDITHQVKLEKAYTKQQKDLLEAEREKNEALENSIKMKDEFLGTITHEFKTPLTVINAALQTIESIYGNQISDTIRKHLKSIRLNSFRQLRLVNNLLDITRYNAGHIKVDMQNLDIVFLTNAIVKSVDHYAKQKGVELIFSSDIRYMEMPVDEEKYERVLLNLLSNSIKFTPKGKSIYVAVSFKKRYAVITIKDEGIGIPKSKQKLIFERFGQVDSSLSRQTEGTGIGLSLVKTLVEGMKGTIKVNSKVCKGSTFTFSLPITKIPNGEPSLNTISTQDSRIMQAVEIEFSDIYL